ncbi:MAG: LPS export ABC transporter ATP-binding protein [Bacillota bacterium]
MAIEVSGLVKRYRQREVVKGVSLHVERGEVVGLLGPNGAGKTTTFYMIVGLERCDQGKIVVDDMEITEMPMHRRAGAGLGYLAQEPSVFRKLTVEENIRAILELRGLTKKKQTEAAGRLMEELNITRIRRQLGQMLSGGERRRVEIARALALSPAYILLDEPFTGVDPIAIADIQQIVQDLKKKNYGVLITDHSVRETLAITDRAYIMHDGQILVSGASASIADNEVAKKFYLGERFRM